MQCLQIMLVGLDRLPSELRLIQSLRSAQVALLAHPASVDRNVMHISRVLEACGIRPVKIFGPEHGYGGEAQDMIGVEHAVDPITNAPIVSLYGGSIEALSPTAEDLQGLNVLLVDLCDVGSRYYTFVWTALLAIRSALKQGMRAVVLDRPNPIGGTFASVEGRSQRSGFLSFVGLEPIPVRHSLTLGEIVAEMCAREGVNVSPDGQVQIVGVQGWQREDLAHRWDRAFVMPSPNMPTPDTALVYPGGCLLEGTNLSEGRGTTRPFEILGAPWLDGVRLARDFATLGLAGCALRPLTFLPTFHKHGGKVCGGVQVQVVDPVAFRPMAAYLGIIALAQKQCPEDFRFRTERYEFVDNIPAIDLLVGGAEAREAMLAGASPREVIATVCPVEDSYGELFARACARVA